MTLSVVFLFAIAALWTLFVGFARLSGSEMTLVDPQIGDLASGQVYDLVRAAATAAGVLAGVFAIVYAYRKQWVQEAASVREDGGQLANRYQDAAEQLGHDKEAVRIAGIYAMSRLADDWPDQRQQCVDVLCAYLRLPDTAPAGFSAREAVLREAIISEIAEHTASGRADGKSWSALRLDLSGAVLHDIDLSDCIFSELILDRVNVVGNVHISRSTVTRCVSLRKTRISGTLAVDFRGKDGRVSAWGAHVEPGGEFRMAAGTSEASQNDFAKFIFGYGVIAEGGLVRIELSPGSTYHAFDFIGTTVAGRLALYGKGAECEPGSIRLRDVTTTGNGEIGIQQQMLAFEGVIAPELKSLKAKIMKFTVGEWEIVPD